MDHLMGAWVKAIGICPVGNNVANWLWWLVLVDFYRATLCCRGICWRRVSHKPVLYCIETTGRIELVFGMDASTYPALCCKEIWVSPKISVGYF